VSEVRLTGFVFVAVDAVRICGTGGRFDESGNVKARADGILQKVRTDRGPKSTFGLSHSFQFARDQSQTELENVAPAVFATARCALSLRCEYE